MDLSIIIVNWNSAKYIRGCLDSIYKNVKGISLEIIVIDNASYDECKRILKSEYPKVKFIQSKQNLGFAGANNLGFKNSTGKVLLFLNPDTEIIGTSIKNIYKKLITISDAGAIGCKLLNTDLSLQTSCVQPFPTILNQVFDIEWLKFHTPQLSLWGISPINLESDNPLPVEAISGACLMIKRDLFEKIGLFSNDYFMYTEDLDLCYKIKKANYKTYYDSKSSVIHFGGGSTNIEKNNKFSDVLMRESIKTFMKKYYGRNYASLYQFVFIFNACLKIYILILLSTLRGKKYLNILKKWLNIYSWSLNREKWAKILNNKARQMK